MKYFSHFCSYLQETIDNFLNLPENLLLIITISADGFLVPFSDFTFDVKNKCVYFVKTTSCCITEENYAINLISGDFNVHFFNHFSALMKHVRLQVVLALGYMRRPFVNSSFV